MDSFNMTNTSMSMMSIDSKILKSDDKISIVSDKNPEIDNILGRFQDIWIKRKKSKNKSMINIPHSNFTTNKDEKLTWAPKQERTSKSNFVSKGNVTTNHTNIIININQSPLSIKLNQRLKERPIKTR